MNSPECPDYPKLRLSWLIWVLAASLYIFGFYQRVAPGVLTRELMTTFALDGAALGNLSAFYFYSYVLMQIPTGVLADRWGPRKLLSIGAVVAGVGTLLFALAPNFLLAAIGRLLIGASVAVAFVCTLKLAVHWLPMRQFSLASGLALLCGIAGAVTAGVPLRLAVDAYGWRPVMMISGLLVFVIAVLIWWFVRDDPLDKGYRSYVKPPVGHTPKEVGSIVVGIKAVLRYRNTWLLYFIPGGVVGPVLTFSGLWGVPFLTTHYDIDSKQAAAICSAMLIAWALGSPVFGWLSDRLALRKVIYTLGLFVQLAAWLPIILVPDLDLYLLVFLLLVIGVFAGSMVISFAFARESVPGYLAGTVAGVVNMGVMMGPMLLQPLTGFLLDRFWTGKLYEGVRNYDFTAYQLSFGIMLIWLFCSCIMILLTRETRGKALS